MSLELRQELSCKQILTLELTITPEAICPKCQYTLTEAEIHAGWSQDRTDIKTKCPSCGFRFVALLFVEEPKKPERRVNFMCVEQVFFRIKCIIKERKRFTKRYGKRKCPDIYYTLCKHFGTFEDGMKKYWDKKSRATL
jgi:hypothetical protein